MARSCVSLAVGLIMLGSAAPVTAALVNYNDQVSFQGALNGSFTLVNLDDPSLTVFGSGYHLDDSGPAAVLAGLGLDSVGFNAAVASGQNFQTPTNRDWLILYGAHFGGQIAFNFTTEVNGVGALTDYEDGGRIRLFSGPNLTGSLLGEGTYGPGSFGGITSTIGIRSVQITCDFNGDLACGAYDLQFGTFAAPAAVPEPSAWALMILGFGIVGGMARRRRSAALQTLATVPSGR